MQMNQRTPSPNPLLPPCEAEVIRNESLRWAVRLTGGVVGVVEYDGRGVGSETVRVDGWVVVRKGSFGGYCPRFDFTLPSTGGAVPACLEVRVSLWLAITALRLTVGETVVHAEGAFRQADRKAALRTLPIPARTPLPSAGRLPIPARSPDPDRETLPRVTDPLRESDE
jgi:hypothetical protein